jgi:hypothetical protein
MSAIPTEQLLELLSFHADGALDDAQWHELVALVGSSPEARRIYIEQMAQHVMMYRIARSHLAPPVIPDVTALEIDGLTEAPAPTALPTRSPVLGFLGDVFRAGGAFLYRPPVLTLLLTVALPVALLLVLWVHIRSQPIPAMPVAGPPAPQAVALAAATIARTHECVWEETGESPAVGTSLVAGGQLRLREGCVELRFADGAAVLLQGPARFDVVAGSSGFLRSGRLVASVSKKARGFMVRTPMAAVVDLGTEFGVCVDEARAKEEVQVFRGKVVLETGPAHANRRPMRRHVTAGSAVSVELADGRNGPTVHEIAFRPDRYVRSLPGSEPAIVADFAGGQGTSAVDQYPGIPGSGWATGWTYRTTRETTCTATVERDSPLADGGDYLRVLIERKSGAAPVRRAIVRELDLDGPVDLRKPHVVSFSARVDSLSLFDNESDTLLFCNNVKREGTRPEIRNTSGWHIRVDAQDHGQVKARNWSFVSGDGKGHSESIDSGIPVHEGETYSFRVLVDPPARQWTPSIAVSGGQWTTFPAMGMRSTGTAEECGYWPHLHLYWVMAGGNQGAEKERIGFSVDSIRITAVEED